MKVSADNVQEVIRALLSTVGITGEDADTIASILSEADMKGISTHGIYFLPMLLQRIKEGLVENPTRIEAITDEGAILHLDGGNGIGQLGAAHAMSGAIGKAETLGIGITLLRNTNHIGLLAHYTLMAAKKGMLGICFSNSAPAIAPWGGTEAFFGTNPLSIAAPGGKGFPIVLDMSTSLVARGKIRRAARLGESIPDSWAIDEDGVPTTDPERALNGTLTPIGGPKGSGLALFIDLISGLISGSNYSRDVKTFHKPLGATGVGCTMIAVDISRFMPAETFAPLIEQYIADIKSAKKAAGGETIYMPGEIELLREKRSFTEGVAVDNGVVASINKLLEEHSLAVRLEKLCNTCA